MKLKKSVLKKLRNNRGYALIMLSLDCSHSAARDYVKFNNDALTKAACLAMLRKEFSMSDEELMETELEVKAAI